MARESSATADLGRFRNWIDGLKERDPELHVELTAKLLARRLQQESGITKESIGERAGTGMDLVLETIVREGRPALLVKDSRITAIDTAVDSTSQEMIRRLRDAAPVIEPLIPLVGRIDVANHAGGLTYVGTGWLIDENKVAINRDS